MNDAVSKDRSVWGLMVAWYPDYTKGRGGSGFEAKIGFLKEYGLKMFCASVEEISALAPGDKDRLFELLEKEDMSLTPYFDANHLLLPAGEADRENDRLLAFFEKHLKHLRSKTVNATCGRSHRYDRAMPFAEKVGRFSTLFRPLAAYCEAAGSPLALENHGDYYCAEIVEFVKATPGMHMIFDTANALHIGEKPLQAALDAAPYAIGTHFKDHGLVMVPDPVKHYEVVGSALGDGDAELEACYRVLKENSPLGDRLNMYIELFKPDGMAAMECWERSMSFISGVRAKYDR